MDLPSTGNSVSANIATAQQAGMPIADEGHASTAHSEYSGGPRTDLVMNETDTINANEDSGVRVDSTHYAEQPSAAQELSSEQNGQEAEGLGKLSTTRRLILTYSRSTTDVRRNRSPERLPRDLVSTIHTHF